MQTCNDAVLAPMSDGMYKALSIQERAELMHDLDLLEYPEERLRELAEQWKQKALLNDRTYTLWLDAHELSEEQFAKVIALAETDDWWQKCRFAHDVKPEWMTWIDEAFALNRAEALKPDGPVHFSVAFRPFILWAKGKLQSFYDANPALSRLTEWDSLLPSIVENLAQAFVQMGARTIVLELHISKQLQELVGESSEERYQSFVQTKLMNPDALEFIYKEYPMLTRLLMLRTHYFYMAVTEALGRYLHDARRIQAELLHGEMRLISLSAGLGDAHQQGRTVMRLHFTGEHVIVYKPKALSIAKHYFELLDWFNRKGFAPALRGHHVIDRDGYAWETFVTYQECKSEAEVERYYKRLGGLLAVLHSVCGLDFHYENIVASGEHPTIVDLETVFHQKTDLLIEETADVEANYKTVNSVLGMGLLPTLVTTTADKMGYDIGGMSAVEQELPVPVLRIENDGTDEMRFVRKTDRSVMDAKNIPKVHGRLAGVTGYIEFLLAGFREASEIIIEHRSELTDVNGPIAKFRHDGIRKLVRVTQYYADFLTESQHPDYLREALEREQLLDRLWFTILDARQIPYEKRDLFEGDFPFFTTYPGSKDLFASKGERITDYFKQTGLEAVMERIRNYTVEYMNEQAEWIEAAVASNAREEMTVSNVAGSAREEEHAAAVTTTTHKEVHLAEHHAERRGESQYDTGLMVEEARQIGFKLMEKAVYGKRDDVTWIGLSANYHGQWQVTALDRGLYNGVSGIALFYAYLYEVTRETDFREMAIKAAQMLCMTRVLPTDFASAFHGNGSVVHTLCHLTALFGEREQWNGCIERHIDNITSTVTQDSYYDIMGGSAGVIQVMLNAHEQLGSQKALHAAEVYGDHLLECAVNTGSGWAWKPPGPHKPLGGFGHGAAGIAAALFRLRHATGREDYYAAAAGALAYDRSLYVQAEGRWADLRPGMQGCTAHRDAWCHGAAGIGLSRVLISRYVRDSGLAEEVETAVLATLRSGMGRSHSLCHGDLGNAELFLLAGEACNRADWTALARTTAMAVLDEKRRSGKYHTGVARRIELPGMMLGLSGIGYQLLRSAKPELVPSVLTLESAR
ncbi:type 2 lanthipeptide synthetase LanM family protein [Paenibacillus xerothermodurans]|uniref:Type 2 lantipeptide synthetase LanM n=1 Tax=Paenibacillus xerothermodurans TaxID=1977292 RepID=A0A2W1NWK4_PAEXE|nr:type 2 lanthipeptide synthetase LanM family protein [Paenibacillus xerothermodurans]PZE20042.1 type 2 lantipeptide synthetase LanM [Paenibacillus xerothermodurans]